MRNPCHFVPLLALALSGCFLLHTGEPDPGPGPAPVPGRCTVPDGMVCCSFRAEPVRTGETDCPFQCPAGSTLTADWECGGAVDAGGRPTPMPPPVPPPTMCPPARAHWACLDEAFIAPVRTAFELPVQIDACTCCADTECVVEADDASRTLRITTTMCPDPCDCDTCVLPTLRCEVPPLRRGDWTVVANGAEAFTLPVSNEEPARSPPACATFAQEDSCALDERISLVPAPPNQVCVNGHRWLDQAEIVLLRSCPDCTLLDGPCQVSLRPRLTDDLPPGGDLYVESATSHYTACDVDCPAICTERAQRCITPPLNDGDFYRIFYEGTPTGSFTAGSDAASCTFFEPPVPG